MYSLSKHKNKTNMVKFNFFMNKKLKILINLNVYWLFIKMF